MNDQQFRQILEHLGYSWAGYRRVRKGIIRRLRNHMARLHCHNLSAYIKALEQDPVLHECQLLLTVSISRFYRDRSLWVVLEKSVLPDLIRRVGDVLKVWSAGCACGQETYTFKILWEMMAEGMKTLPRLELLATDMNPLYLEKALNGVYPGSNLKNVPQRLRSACFEAVGDEDLHAVSGRLKDSIRWHQHDLLSDAPDRGFHLIFIRNNLLTYYKDERRDPAFSGIVESLTPGGYLIIGSHERIPSGTTGLLPCPVHPSIFRAG